MTETVRVDLAERGYDILIGRNLLRGAGEAARSVLRGNKAMVVCDATVREPWSTTVTDSLVRAGFDVSETVVPTGEPSKCARELVNLWDAMAERDFARDSAVIAVGGGVIGDLSGFAAASFLRGIDFIQVPTSLLAMVDSSVGGKTGINLNAGKNLVGAFWQPRLVLADLDCLSTLPTDERSSGLAEVIKYGVIRDSVFFDFLEDHVDKLFVEGYDTHLTHAIKRSVEIKAEVVVADEREGGLRRILNFGHTLGHAIEAEGGYHELKHGESISIGMVAASLMAVKRNAPGWKTQDHERLVDLFRKIGLPVQIPSHMTADALLDRTRVDKKVAKGVVRYMLPTRMGHVETVGDVEDTEVLAVCGELGAS